MPSSAQAKRLPEIIPIDRYMIQALTPSALWSLRLRSAIHVFGIQILKRMGFRVSRWNVTYQIISEFQNRVLEPDKELASYQKLHKLLLVVGLEKFMYFADAFGSTPRRDSSEHLFMSVASVSVRHYLEADPKTDSERLSDLKRFGDELYALRDDVQGIFRWIATNDTARPFQKMLRDVLCRTLLIPPDRIIFLDFKNEWLRTLLGFVNDSSTGRCSRMAAQLSFTTADNHPRDKIIVVRSDISNTELPIVLAHEGSHWQQLSGALDAMREHRWAEFMAEGLQRHREFAIITQMAQDPRHGSAIRDLFSLPFKYHMKDHVLELADKIWHFLFALSRVGSLPESALVREIIVRTGIEPMMSFFVSGQTDALERAFQDESLTMIKHFFTLFSFTSKPPSSLFVPTGMLMHVLRSRKVDRTAQERITSFVEELRAHYLLDNRLSQTKSVFDLMQVETVIPLLDRFLDGELGRELLTIEFRAILNESDLPWQERLLRWIPNYNDYGPPPDPSLLLLSSG